MKGKIALVIGAAAGYVLGTRDGRQRYDEIKAKAENLWQDPKVQDKVSQAKQAVGSTQAEDSSTASTPTPTPARPGGALDD